MSTTARTPQDRQPKRPSLQRKHTRASEAAAEESLDRGLAFTDEDGTRLQVRIRDVKGRHDVALIAATGLDFVGLLGALERRQGLDLLAAVVWFGRLVNGRDTKPYAELLDDFGYADVMAADIDEPKLEDDRPEA